MKNTILAVSCIILIACETTPTDSVDKNSSTGIIGNISYTHDVLSSNKHFLVIKAKPELMETESSIAQRIHQYSVRFAAKTCPDDFKFIDDPNMRQKGGGGFMKRTKSYTFLCH